MSKKNKIFVQFLLDKSGSMQGNWRNTISMIEEYVSSLKADRNTSYRFSLNYFSSGESRPIQRINMWRNPPGLVPEPMTTPQYGDCFNGLVKGFPQPLEQWTRLDVYPGGMTALNDAIGFTVHDIQKMHENGQLRKGEMVQFVIITDGGENSSQTFTQYDVNSLLDSFKARDWSVLFLGDGEQVANQGISYGLMPQQVVNINLRNTNHATIGARAKSLSQSTMAYACSGDATAALVSDADRKVYEKSD